MARRSNQKLKLLYLSKILLEQTDAQRGLTLSQILSELSKYGIEAGRKSLYDDMEALRVYGLDVRTKRDRYVKYYIENRKFDKAELMLISDMIAQSGLLTERKSKELIRKLRDFGVIYDGAEQGLSPKALNEDAYNNLELICNAISNDKRITFRCFEWNARKQRILSNRGEYFLVSPYKLVFKDGRYLLEAFDHAKKAISLFATERLLDLSLVNKKREVPTEVDMASECRDVSNIRLRCDNSVAGDIFERFGINVTILLNREEYFEISAKAVISPEFFSWVFKSAGKVRIISPEWAVEKYEEMLIEGIRDVRARDEKK